MVQTKELMLGITLTMLCLPALCNTHDEQTDKKQQLEFLSFLAFIGSVSDMEAAGVDIDQLLTDPSRETSISQMLPAEEDETNE